MLRAKEFHSDINIILAAAVPLISVVVDKKKQSLQSNMQGRHREKQYP